MVYGGVIPQKTGGAREVLLLEEETASPERQELCVESRTQGERVGEDKSGGYTRY